MPHGHCYLWLPALVWTHVISDALIGLSYVVIAFTLYYFVRRFKLPFSAMFVAFGLFIFACGATHFMEIWNLWHADYWVSGGVKGVTAIASITTAVALVRLRPEAKQVAEATRLAEQRQLSLQSLAAELENRVSERENELRLISNFVPVLIASIDRDFHYRAANATYEKWFGLTTDQVVGKHMTDVIGPKVFADYKALLERAFGGETVSVERDIDYPRGPRRYVQVNFSPRPSVSGEIDRVIIFVTDLSERREQERQLNEAKRKAEEASRAKSEFLANMSHEIRTPLGAILGFTELMADLRTAEGERKRFAEIVHRNGRQLTNLIDDILDLSKVESGRIELENVEVSVRETAQDVLVGLEASARGKGLTLRMEPFKDIPERLFLDPTRLKQILINLIGNAIKFTERGEVVVSAYMMPAEQGGKSFVAVRVRDTGIGVPEEHRAKLFQSFVQADSSMTRRFGGTGLGLALSKRLARALGGDLHLVETEAGRGSVFELLVPTGNQATKGFSRPGAFDAAIPAEPASLQGVRVLIAEDSPDNQLLLKRVLAPQGVAVDFAANGSEAVQKALEGDFDIVLMDMQMPVKNGYEATRELRAAGYSGPIVALTAHALHEERERAMDSGCDDHLTKPLEMDLLIATLGRFKHKAAKS